MIIPDETLLPLAVAIVFVFTFVAQLQLFSIKNLLREIRDKL